jgi:hypothetical protein
MPRERTFNRGGQRRTTECPCGFSVRGDVRTANFKMKLHLKLCKNEEKEKYTPSPFNSANGMINGWDGLVGSNQANERLGQIIRGGEDIGVRIEDKIKKEHIYVSKVPIMGKLMCCLCDEEIDGYGNNPAPVAFGELKCCDKCNASVVIPARINELRRLFVS